MGVLGNWLLALLATHTSAIAVAPGDETVAVVNPDSDTVSLIDAGDLSVAELDVGVHPRTLSWNADGSRLFVACYGSNELWVLDDAGGVVDMVTTGHQPFGVVVSPLDGNVVVTHEGGRTVAILDPDTLDAIVSTEVEPMPRAIAIASSGIYVTHFLTLGDVGQVTVLDATGTVLDVIELAEDPGPDTDTSGQGFPNLLGVAAFDPSETTLWVGGEKQNTGRGLYIDGLPLLPDHRVRGLLAPIDAATGVEGLGQRIDTFEADSVTGVAFAPAGDHVYLAHQGAGTLSVYDPTLGTLEARVDTGDAPQGVAVTSDGARAYVSNFMSRDVAVFDLADPADPALLDTIEVTLEPLPGDVARGKTLFYRSRAPVHSSANYIACAGCHPDGGHDGRTWDFTQFGEGLRNTIDLRGHGGTAHGPVHWTANFDEIQDFEHDIRNGFGGEGLLDPGDTPYPPLDAMKNAGRSADLDALAAYVASLDRPPPSPYRDADGELSEAALRGMEVFFDELVGCDDCHQTPRFTDSRLGEDAGDFLFHIVGTIGPGSGSRKGHFLPGFDTPTVLGIWAGAPFLHDGRAATLLDMLTIHNPEDQHGITSHLTADELDDLVVYMLSLQGDPDEYPEEPADDTGTSSSGGSTSGPDDTTGTPPASSSGPPPPGSSSSAPPVDPSDGSTGAAQDDPPGAAGCGCTSGGALPWGCVLLGLPLVRRRRRR